MWWDDTKKEVYFCELTVCFESSSDAATNRKEARYQDIVSAATDAGYSADLITIEVGSRGLPNMGGGGGGGGGGYEVTISLGPPLKRAPLHFSTSVLSCNSWIRMT